MRFVATLALFALTACAKDADTPSAVTFSEHIAPIVFENCVPCHRPEGSGPFPFTNYEEVNDHAGQIAEVTASRFMPPWQPTPGYGHFVGERLLTDAQIDLISRWVASDTPEGDPQHLPPLPAYSDEWQLGPPDLIVEMDEPYILPAEGYDQFRNFVMPIPTTTPRYVEAVEFHADNAQVIHHAVMMFDRSGTARKHDARESGPGFDGMVFGEAQGPNGHFLGWTPGKQPYRDPELAWSLVPGTDLVLQLHMLPSGRPESLRARIGFYYADAPPKRTPALVRLGRKDIDIPAGQAHYPVRDTYQLPVAVEVTSIYPHAHYLGKSMAVYALLPDGKKEWLIRIDEWVFNWQDDYRYAEPVALVQGTTIQMRFTYDNSAENDRNPNNPPKRVTYGELSSDEMGSLWMQVIPRRAADLDKLKNAIADKNAAHAIAGFQFALQLNPSDPEALSNLGAALSVEGKFTEARGHFEKALIVDPDRAATHFNLGLLMLDTGNPNDAKLHFEKTVAIDPTNAEAWSQLGHLALESQDQAQAIACFKRSLESRKDVEAYYNIGVTYLAMNQPHDAIPFLETAARISPQDVLTQLNLGACHFNIEDWNRAETRFRNTTLLAPEFVPGYLNLGNALIKQQRIEEALKNFKRAAQLAPNNQQAWESVTAAQRLLNAR